MPQESRACTHMGFAIAELEAKLNENPDDFLPRHYLMHHYGRWDRAKLREHTYRAIREAPGHHDIYFANLFSGEFYRDTQYCCDVLRQLLEAVKEHAEPDVHQRIAELYELMGVPPASPGSMAEWRRSFEIPDDVPIISQPDPTYVSEAKKHYEAAMARTPADDSLRRHGIRCLYGRLCVRLHEWEHAAALYEEALRCLPDGKWEDDNEPDTDTYIRLANVYYRLNDNVKARECLFKAIELDQGSDSLRTDTSWACVELGQLAVVEGDLDEARAYLRKSVKANPHHATGLFAMQVQLVESLAECGDTQTPREFRELLKLQCPT